MKLLSLTAACALLAVPLAGCGVFESTDKGDKTGSGAISVTSSNDACTLSTTETGSGTVTFKVKNSGSKVTEFYLYAEDGKRIVGEVENIGPGLTRELVVTAAPGKYVTACKPGMEGDGIRGDFTVTDSGTVSSASEAEQANIDRATDGYADYVKHEAEELLEETTEFVTAYTAGDDARARALYPTARMHWERIEPVAESFGDLDPKTDAREADLAKGQKWTGWHRIEKDLWPQRAKNYRPLSPQQRTFYGDDLLKNVTTVRDRIRSLTFTIDQIANGSSGLMEEVATGKVTGEEEYWSHTDLWDFAANVKGSEVAFEDVKPILEKRDPALAKTLTHRFTEIDRLLAQQKTGNGYRLYTELSKAEIRRLADAVNGLSEPLSHLTAAVLS